MSLRAKLYITAIVAAGLACFGYGIAHWTCRDPFSFLCLLGLALGTSLFKMTVPGRPTSLSVSFVLVLFSIIDFSYAETLVVGCLAAAVQAVWRKNHQSAVQFLFNLSTVAVSVRVGYVVYHGLDNRLSVVASIAIAAIAYFLTNTFAISAVIGLTSGSSIYKTWLDCHFWLFPYYLLGADIALLASWGNRHFGWETVVLALPAAYILFRSYRLYLERVEREKCHAEQMADLHLRTIEALAMAIEARDATTHNHLVRVQVYAVELGKALQLTEAELQALQAASILHDIGKLAVPEHIISKPGKLTIEEFEKMKIHPGVGAEILERVGFPYAVVPIVRSHHERWNGAGYPDGLKGEAIPLGARILAVVDCLDALASDREYHRALPLDEAMAVVESEAGKSYDPRVVEALRANYREWEKLSRTKKPRAKPLSTGPRVTGGAAPAAGLQVAVPPEALEPNLASLATAVQDEQALYESSQSLGNSFNLHETLSVLDSRLRRLIPYDAIAVYVREEDQLTPKYVNGESMRHFSMLQVPVGQGISGWVAQSGEPIVNGNPSGEPGGLNDPACKLRSVLAIPLGNAAGTTGVLILYHLDHDAFTKDHLRVLLALKSKLSLTIENPRDTSRSRYPPLLTV
jgi:putative nucleotidyltransferase with HDIG domain